MSNHCWMSDALFKKVENGQELFVEARNLVEGSLVRAADGKILKVADSPERHDTGTIVVLHAGGAQLSVTPNHRVPVLTHGEWGERYAKDVQTGDFISVDNKPAE